MNKAYFTITPEPISSILLVTGGGTYPLVVTREKEDKNIKGISKI